LHTLTASQNILGSEFVPFADFSPKERVAFPVLSVANAGIGAYLLSRENLPTRYRTWIEDETIKKNPNIDKEVCKKVFVKKMIEMVAENTYVKTEDSINEMRKLFGLEEKIRLFDLSRKDTIEDILVRTILEAEQKNGKKIEQLPNFLPLFLPQK
jgi:hypothetical protein